MSEASERIKQKINSNSSEINDNVKMPQNKESRLRNFITAPLRFICGMFGVDLKNLKKVDTMSGPGSAGHYPPPGGNAWKEGYRVPQRGGLDPHTFNPVDVENTMIYIGGIDGKGDHDCDCEHDL